MGPEASPRLAHEDDHPVTPRRAECLMLVLGAPSVSVNAL